MSEYERMLDPNEAYRQWKKNHLDSDNGYRPRLREVGWDCEWRRTARGAQQEFRVFSTTHDWFVLLYASDEFNPEWEEFISELEQGQTPTLARGSGDERAQSQHIVRHYNQCAVVQRSSGKQCANVAKDGMDVCRVHKNQNGISGRTIETVQCEGYAKSKFRRCSWTDEPQHMTEIGGKFYCEYHKD